MNLARRCGVLLHVSSLPSRHGIGDFGPCAHEYIDFLAAGGQGVWQMLPLAPINAGAGNSPYSSYSAFAGNTLFISPELLVRQGVLRPRDVEPAPDFPQDRVDYAAAAAWRERILEQAFDNAFPGLRADVRFDAFCRKASFWLDDYCLFAALKREQRGAPWLSWPRGLRLREPDALEQARERLGYDILRERYFQYLFSLHWENLRDYAATRGVALLGDVPIYVSLDSSDVWAHRELFELDREGLPIYCAGAPPDYFSKTGQMWGNPVYDWAFQEKDGFSWWAKRLRHESERFDMLRLDHFRGFCGFWQVPACEPTAENGLWIKGPGAAFFSAMKERVPGLSILAEDLGVITEDVVTLMREFEFPGMKILQFAFSEEMGKNAYIPHNFPVQSAVYTGTHDNNTVRGWFSDELDDQGRGRLRDYAGRHVSAEDAADVMIRLALGSVAALCIIPMQDYLNLDATGRMNMPGVAGGNWGWRMQPGMATRDVAARMRFQAWIYGRVAE
ncbi:4-alpha-glucanotransferase [Desulfomicrobium baculatum]|uniref:4-alpha-glucanotransferase n=1 Tax=Desulfomicrobium baculatum (strain DSM 4028 / VKM B-1378 / X) TaxID=525897 RepID=C7LV30_DESBD|nr:4-alpha-glucanotransferase [Desulfomicrobium baculatum]ACU91034.1 4-alpha-glucanotransferase [Desulfomicrobium baculatum DSM 4028]